MCDLETVLPLLPQLALVDVMSVTVVDGTLVVMASTRAGPAACTGCGWSADRVHSAYERHVVDEAVGGRSVRIDLTVRRLYRENPDCPKVTFAEQVPGLTRRYQRRTPALQTVVDAVAAGVGRLGRSAAAARAPPEAVVDEHAQPPDAHCAARAAGA